MPIRINFLDGGAGIEFVVTGTLTGAEILAANRQVYTRENLLRLQYDEFAKSRKKLSFRTHVRNLIL